MRIGDRTQNQRRNLLYQEDRCLWIDSLCINQDDHDEKSDQVGVMGRIYRQAEQVRVWLGDKSDDSDRVFGLIDKITELDGIEGVIGKASHTRDWRAFGALMRRKWFSRRWIVQEIALARKATIHCGRKMMDWDKFSKGVSLYESRSEEVLRSLVNHEKQVTNASHISVQVQALGAHSLISTLHQLFRRGRSNEISEYLLPLDTLMSMLPNFDVSNSKDVIYAIRSLAKDFQEPDWCGNGPSIINSKKKAALMPNYNQTTLDLFLEFIKYVIETTKRLDILCVPWAPSLKGDEAGNYLPSWITQVSKRPFSQHEDEKDGHFRRDNADSLVGRLGADQMVYKVSGNTTTKEWVVYKDDRHHPRLVVRGRKIGDIGELGDSAEKGWVPYSWLDMAVEAEKRRELKIPSAGGKKNGSITKSTASMANLSIADVSNGKSNKVPKFEVPDSFWRTLVGDRGPNGTNPQDFYKDACNQSFAIKRQFLKTDEQVSNAVWNSKHRMERSKLEFLRRVQAAT
ncbi:hypothetical protein BDZ45DRAFT_191581 [Acephala macrosclerotiorum]|nr:hypothetical protein BDZ45DRAFT_191581 [Acephala macrosclerotiorum]